MDKSFDLSLNPWKYGYDKMEPVKFTSQDFENISLKQTLMIFTLFSIFTTFAIILSQLEFLNKFITQ